VVNGTCTGCGAGPWNPDGSLNDLVVASLTRTYPQAVAGQTVAFRFNQTTHVFQLDFVLDPVIAEPTVIYLNPSIYYPQGFEVEIEPAQSASWTLEGNHTVLVAASADAEAGPVRVTIRPQ
jgi:hypothetical protein